MTELCTETEGDAMQDFLRYDYTLTLEQLRRVMTEDGQTVVAIINGEYYDIIPPADSTDCDPDKIGT